MQVAFGGVYLQYVVVFQFHSDPLSAINACYEGDTVIVCPGHYMVHGTFAIADSIELEGESRISCDQTLWHDNAYENSKSLILLKLQEYD